MTDTLPEQTTPRVVLVAITKHGAQQTADLARQLPDAHVCVAEKFAPLMAGLPNTVRAYAGAFRDEIAALFADYDQVVFFVSLGAVVRLIAPHLKSKDEDPGVEAGSPDWWTRPTPLPANIHKFARFDDVDLARFKAVLWITHAEVSEQQWDALAERLVVYRPPHIVSQ